LAWDASPEMNADERESVGEPGLYRFYLRSFAG